MVDEIKGEPLGMEFNLYISQTIYEKIIGDNGSIEDAIGKTFNFQGIY